MLQWNILQYFICNERLEILLKCLCNPLCYVEDARELVVKKIDFYQRKNAGKKIERIIKKKKKELQWLNLKYTTISFSSIPKTHPKIHNRNQLPHRNYTPL